MFLSHFGAKKGKLNGNIITSILFLLTCPYCLMYCRLLSDSLNLSFLFQ